MGDDLDTLLDEVERKFCGKVSVSAGEGQEDEKLEKKADEQRKRSSKCKVPVGGHSDDLDAFIDKLLEEDCGAFTSSKTETSSKGTAAVKKCSSQSRGRKCCPVFIGGSSVQSGIGSTASRRSCDQLRCMSCDFGVLVFDDCEWDRSCDYLFFRNNVPERSKLQAKLRRRCGLRSYCCQCSWTSVSQIKELTPPLTWSFVTAGGFRINPPFKNRGNQSVTLDKCIDFVLKIVHNEKNNRQEKHIHYKCKPCNHTTDPPTHPPTHPPTNSSTNSSTNSPTNSSTNSPTNSPIVLPTCQPCNSKLETCKWMIATATVSSFLFVVVVGDIVAVIVYCLKDRIWRVPDVDAAGRQE